MLAMKTRNEHEGKEKSVEELLRELHELDQKSNIKSRKLEPDKKGNLLLDPSNKDDVEWYNNDEDYDVI